MKSWNSLGRALTLFCGLLFCGPCQPSAVAADVAYYAGQPYTPETFPRMLWCNCSSGMCAGLRSQLGIPQFSPRGITDRRRNENALAEYRAWKSQQAVQVVAPQPKVIPSSQSGTLSVATARRISQGETQGSSQQHEQRTVMKEITETKTEMKWQCVNGVCQWVPVQSRVKRMVPVVVNVPIKPKAIVSQPKSSQPKPEDTPLQATPQEVVAAMVDSIGVQVDEVFWDVGCGDGRSMIAAAQRGARVYGVEINPETAKLARRKMDEAGVEGRVIVGDAMKLEGIAADCVFLHLFDDQLARVVAKLSPGTRVVSYAHRVPGFPNKRHTVGEHEFFSMVVPIAAM